MYVLGLERVWFGVLRGFTLDPYLIERDDDDIRFMVRRAEEFWDDYVVAGTPPPVDGAAATAGALRAVYPTDVADKAAPVDPDLLAEYWAAHDEVQAAGQRKQLAANAIRAAMGDAESGVIDDRVAVTWRTQTKTTIDIPRFRLAHPRIAARFEQTTQARVLRPKRPNT
jgi:predicted phage-related endonuclease